MTIAELKELIKDIPDDYTVMVQTLDEYLPIFKEIDIDESNGEVVLYEQFWWERRRMIFKQWRIYSELLNWIVFDIISYIG